jgi:hypothetical protein
VITLKGMAQNKLEVAPDGSLQCGTTAENESSFTPGSGCQEFVVDRVGMGAIKKHDTTIRAGAEICLRPVRGPGCGDNAVEASNYVKCAATGDMSADGKVTNKEICSPLMLRQSERWYRLSSITF